MDISFSSYIIPIFDQIDINKIKQYIDIFPTIFEADIEVEVNDKVNEIEVEYEIKLNELKEVCYDEEKINNYKSMNSLVILQKELEIINILTKYSLQNNQLDYNFFLACLNLLLNLSEILRIRLDQKKIIHETKIYTPTNIPRCSYKFCNYKDTCIYNYNKNNKNMCYQDHYVHRMVSADLTVLINYIEQKYINQNFVIHNKEILKTINTLSFVINHMESELKTKCLHLDESLWNSCHFIKSK